MAWQSQFHGGCARSAAGFAGWLCKHGTHHFFFTWDSSSLNDGRSPEKSTLRPNSMATCGA